MVLDRWQATLDTEGMVFFARARLRPVCRFLAATLLLTQFMLIAQAWASPNFYQIAHPVNCSESMGMHEQKGKPCPVEVCLQNLTLTEKFASTNNLAGSGTHFVQPLLMVVSANLPSSSLSSQPAFDYRGSDPPLAIRFCSFQI